MHLSSLSLFPEPQVQWVLQHRAGKATLSKMLPSISALNPMGTALREGFTTAPLLPEAAFITSVSLMKQRLCFLRSMNPPLVTCLLSGKSGLFLPDLV